MPLVALPCRAIGFLSNGSKNVYNARSNLKYRIDNLRKKQPPGVFVCAASFAG